MNLLEALDRAPENNKEINESIVITHDKLSRYKKILCTISGGSDSDIVLDLCEQFDESKKITYVYFDTGLEFEATKRHLNYLEERYGVTIHRVRAEKPIPVCCKIYGQPFISKQVSEWIERLQKHNFTWEDKPFDELYSEYPECKAALRWWCNDFERTTEGKESSFNIGYHAYLKDFMIENPPSFKISNKCCYYAKKRLARAYIKKGEYTLNIYGVRKSEGGARRSAYKSCFSSSDKDCDEYRPIFWFLKDTKKEYEEHYGIVHSDCYTQYGLKRTGCAGCPYGRNFEDELKSMEIYEPQLFKAVNNIFYDSYDYTKKYRSFAEEKRRSFENGTKDN